MSLCDMVPEVGVQPTRGVSPWDSDSRTNDAGTSARAGVCFIQVTAGGASVSRSEIDACIVWNKGWIGLGRSHYRPQHEFILYASGEWHAGADESDVWSISRDPAASYLHPTQKPVELIERCLVNSSMPGAAVIDLVRRLGLHHHRL
jgi:DNA methylase